MSTNGSIIETQSLTKYYGEQVGIEDLTIQITKGEIFGFLGQNGAGKTTTIRTLLNILIPDKGTATVFGQTITRKNPQVKENIGYLPGELNFPQNFTVKELLDYMSELRKRPDTRRDEIVQLFELDVSKRVKQLSKGNKQKVGIVLSFMHDPDLLILDEPTSGLDPIYQQILLDLIIAEKAKGKTIFFSSHNLDEVQKICDRVAIIREGKLVSVENVHELAGKVPRRLLAMLRQPDVEKLKSLGTKLRSFNEETGEVELGVENSDDLPQLLQMLSSMGLKDLSYPPASLEEFFITQYRS